VTNPENLEGQGFHTDPSRINRAGKAKGTRNRSTIVREALDALDTVSGLTNAEAITYAAVKKALTGDVAAFKELMDSGFGKLDTPLDLKSTDGTMTPAASRAKELAEKIGAANASES